MTKFEKNAARLVCIILCITVASLMLSMLADAFIYGLHSWTIHGIERQAEEGIWTKDGLLHWTQPIIDDYNEACADRDAFIASSDVGSFLYHSAFSTMGKILRVLTVVGILAVAVVSLKLSVYMVKLIIRSFTKKPKNAQRSHRR